MCRNKVGHFNENACRGEFDCLCEERKQFNERKRGEVFLLRLARRRGSLIKEWEEWYFAYVWEEIKVVCKRQEGR